MRRTMKDTSDTLRESILLMQEKILANRDDFVLADLAITVKKKDGNTTIRPNPFVQEYRALVKDYYIALKAYKELKGTEQTEVANLKDIRARLKVAK